LSLFQDGLAICSKLLHIGLGDDTLYFISNNGYSIAHHIVIL
jgi:hypothetical protein